MVWPCYRRQHVQYIFALYEIADKCVQRVDDTAVASSRARSPRDPYFATGAL